MTALSWGLLNLLLTFSSLIEWDIQFWKWLFSVVLIILSTFLDARKLISLVLIPHTSNVFISFFLRSCPRCFLILAPLHRQCLCWLTSWCDLSSGENYKLLRTIGLLCWGLSRCNMMLQDPHHAVCSYLICHWWKPIDVFFCWTIVGLHFIFIYLNSVFESKPRTFN